MLCRRYDDNNWVRRRRLRYCVLLDKKNIKIPRAIVISRYFSRDVFRRRGLPFKSARRLEIVNFFLLFKPFKTYRWVRLSIFCFLCVFENLIAQAVRNIDRIYLIFTILYRYHVSPRWRILTIITKPTTERKRIYTSEFGRVETFRRTIYLRDTKWNRHCQLLLLQTIPQRRSVRYIYDIIYRAIVART